ncbi:MAG TPA: hypothetical protein VGD91_01790 [Trebonia sp.]
MDEGAQQAAQGNAKLGTAATADAELAALPGEITLEMLRETFDHWTIGTANDRLWAFRTGDFAAGGARSLIRACVMADTATRLAEQLCIQAWLQSLSAGELEAVWREGTMAVRP